MKKRKNNQLAFVCAVATLLVSSGCETLSTDYKQERPVDYEVAQGRSGEIGREILDNENDQKTSVAIISENPNQKDATALTLDKYVFDNLDVAITNLGKFDVVPRAELAAIINESKVQSLLNDQTVALPQTAPRYLIIYNIVYSNFASRIEKVVDQAKLADETRKAMQIQDTIQKSIALAGVTAKATVSETRYVGFAKVKITIYDTKTQKRIYAQTLSGYSKNSENKAGNIGLINEALENIVKDYMVQFATDFAPAAAVLMTKGSGKIAMLNIGRQHGVLIGTEIEFIEYLEGGKKTRAVPFAQGKVFEIDNDTCWVMVDDYDEVCVRKYTVARVKPTQSKSSQINSLD